MLYWSWHFSILFLRHRSVKSSRRKPWWIERMINVNHGLLPLHCVILFFPWKRGRTLYCGKRYFNLCLALIYNLSLQSLLPCPTDHVPMHNISFINYLYLKQYSFTKPIRKSSMSLFNYVIVVCSSYVLGLCISLLSWLEKLISLLPISLQLTFKHKTYLKGFDLWLIMSLLFSPKRNKAFNVYDFHFAFWKKKKTLTQKQKPKVEKTKYQAWLRSNWIDLWLVLGFGLVGSAGSLGPMMITLCIYFVHLLQSVLTSSTR